MLLLLFFYFQFCICLFIFFCPLILLALSKDYLSAVLKERRGRVKTGIVGIGDASVKDEKAPEENGVQNKWSRIWRNELDHNAFLVLGKRETFKRQVQNLFSFLNFSSFFIFFSTLETHIYVMINKNVCHFFSSKFFERFYETCYFDSVR